MNATAISTIAICIALTACKDDPKLVAKRGEQEVEIAKLRGELVLAEERLQNVPPDQTEELDKANVETKHLEEEHQRLTAKLAELEATRRTLQEEYEAYKKKYSVP